MEKYEFSEFEAPKKPIKQENLDLLDEVPVFYHAKVGKGQMSIKELKNIQKGQLVPLNVPESALFSLAVGEEKSKEVFKGRIVVVDGELHFKVED